ncbi:MAG: AsmA family protein, partial [Rickettsiales bacterium]|nr:AsmA family protein [Rickettsiales bacterium]
MNLKVRIHDFITHLKSYIFQLHKTTFKIVSLTLCAIVLLLFWLPLFLNNAALKFQVEQDVSKALGANFTINSDVEISFLPSLSLSAKNVLLKNYNKKNKIYNFYAKSAQVELSWFHLLSGNKVVKNLSVSNFILESHYDSDTAIHKDDFTDLLSKISTSQTKRNEKEKSSSIISQISLENLDLSQSNKNSINFTLKNGKTIFYNQDQEKTELENIDANLTLKENKIRASGDFINQQIVNNFRFIANFNSSSSWTSSILELSSPIFNLNIKGNFSSENNGLLVSDFDGKIEAEIIEPKTFYKNYVSNSESIYNKLKSGTNVIKISGHVKNIGGEATIDELIINSALLNGKGNVELNFAAATPIVDINLDLDNLDLDNIWSSEISSTDATKKITQQNVNPVIFDADNNPLAKEISPDAAEVKESHLIADKSRIENKIPTTNKIRNVDLTSEITVKNVKFLGGEIKDVDLYMITSKEGEILILPLIFKIPGEGSFRVMGSLYQSEDNPRIIGTIDVSGKKLSDVFKWLKIESQNLKFDNLQDYILYSNILLTPNNIFLNNLYLNLGNDKSELLGEIKIDSSSKTLQISNKFRISSFNLDDYFLISGQNVYLSSGSLLKKMLWLNDINSNSKLELVFDKLIYKGEEFYNESINLTFGQGYLEINGLKLESDNTSLTTNLKVDIRDNDPRFEIEIVGDKFHYNSTKNIISDNKETIANSALDQFFALPSLESFNGKISINLGDLILDNVEIKDTKLSGDLKNGNIENAELSFNLYGGNFNYKGLLGLKYSKVINGNLSFNNVALENLLPDLIGVKNISGVTNISASVTTLASKKEEFITNLVSNIKFSSNSPVVDGYGLNDLVKKMFNPNLYSNDLLDLGAILFNPQSKTQFKSADGNIIISKNQDNKFRINLTGFASNGILSGKLDLPQGEIDALNNIIFLTGNQRKQIPINIATSLKGKFENIAQVTNFNQAEQYLGQKITAPQNVSTPLPETNAKSPDIANDNLEISDKQKAITQIKEAMNDPEGYMKKQQKLQR